MKWFNKFYNWAKPEGWLGLSLCFFLFMLVAPVFWAFVPNKALALCLSVTLIEALAGGYALCKSLNGEPSSWHELLCDNIGIGVGVVVYIISMLLLSKVLKNGLGLLTSMII